MNDKALWIALDTMGTDHGSAVVTRGGLRAISEDPDVHVYFVGDESEIKSVCSESDVDASRYRILHTDDVVGMQENPVEVLRKKPNSSLVSAVRLCRDGETQAVISPGSTGAMVAASTLLLRHLRGVRRAGIVAVLPTVEGRVAIIDVGANVNCKPRQLFQYAVMCSLYAEDVLGLPNPRVGLLSVGSEKTKGSTLVKETNACFVDSRLNFIGNIEGHEVFQDKVDVVVCEGFVGNVVLKIVEGVASAILGISHQQATKVGLVAHEGYGQMVSALKKRLDWTEEGGAQLLGVNGISIIAHGRSDEKAIAGAARTAAQLVALGLNDRIVEALSEAVDATT